MSDFFLGEIRVFSGPQAPAGWMWCNGIELKAGEYPALYSLLGNQFGGTAPLTFALPDLTELVIVGMSGTNLPTDRTAYKFGDAGGAKTFLVEPAHIPRHSHTVQAIDANAVNVSPATTQMLASGYRGSGTPASRRRRLYDNSENAVGEMSNQAVLPADSLKEVNIDLWQPTLVCNYIIAVKESDTVVYPFFPA
ncbi:MAG: hypothetical protein EP335_12690 [Alphaproteobacteria bacterium]|nr:MAG: hypothetical protein EP335_12690 [Alphaproteobacteria bacterium]